MPHSRFWTARASANVSRPQPRAPVIGSRKSPKIERAPKPTIASRQAAARTTAGVCQAGGTGRTEPGTELAVMYGSALESDSGTDGRCANSQA